MQGLLSWRGVKTVSWHDGSYLTWGWEKTRSSVVWRPVAFTESTWASTP
jgi:hypothetical protein